MGTVTYYKPWLDRITPVLRVTASSALSLTYKLRPQLLSLKPAAPLQRPAWKACYYAPFLLNFLVFLDPASSMLSDRCYPHEKGRTLVEL